MIQIIVWFQTFLCMVDFSSIIVVIYSAGDPISKQSTKWAEISDLDTFVFIGIIHPNFV